MTGSILSVQLSPEKPEAASSAAEPPTQSLTTEADHQHVSSKASVVVDSKTASPVMKPMVTIRDLLPFINGTATDIGRNSADAPRGGRPSIANLRAAAGTEAVKSHHRAMLGGVASLSERDWARVREEKGGGTYVYSFGGNEHGQCGTGDSRNQISPRLVSALRDRAVLQIVAGGMHSMALLDDGSCAPAHLTCKCRLNP